jgi:hypothetical protein
MPSLELLLTDSLDKGLAICYGIAPESKRSQFGITDGIYSGGGLVTFNESFKKTNLGIHSGRLLRHAVGSCVRTRFYLVRYPSTAKFSTT